MGHVSLFLPPSQGFIAQSERNAGRADGEGSSENSEKERRVQDQTKVGKKDKKYRPGSLARTVARTQSLCESVPAATSEVFHPTKTPAVRSRVYLHHSYFGWRYSSTIIARRRYLHKRTVLVILIKFAAQIKVTDRCHRSVTTHAAWRIIPTTYILCMGDKPSTVAAAQYLIDTAKASGQHRIDNVIKHDVGHSPFISQPEWLAQTLIEEAGREA